MRRIIFCMFLAVVYCVNLYSKDSELIIYNDKTKKEAATVPLSSLVGEWVRVDYTGNKWEKHVETYFHYFTIGEEGSGSSSYRVPGEDLMFMFYCNVKKSSGNLSFTWNAKKTRVLTSGDLFAIGMGWDYKSDVSQYGEKIIRNYADKYGYGKGTDTYKILKIVKGTFLVLRDMNYNDSYYCKVDKNNPDAGVIANKLEEESMRETKEKERERQRIAEEKERERERIAWEKERERQRIADEKFEKDNTLKANDGDIEAQYQLSLFYLKNNNYKAVKWLEKCAQQNYKDSPKKLGMYYYNRGDQYYEEAIPWLEMAAKQGEVNSQFALGKIYMTQKKYKEASIWLEAAQKNRIDVKSLLRDCYVGLARTSQPNEAESWYKKAQQIESTEELTRELADFYFENGKYSQAEANYLRLINLTSHNKKNLGEIYEKNVQSATSTKDKISWMEKAYKLSSSQLVQVQLRDLYEKYGDECKKSGEFVTAVDAYQRGSNYGSQVAKYKLANMYEKGLGVEKNLDVAFSYHKENADAGYKPSQRKLVYGSGFILFESAFSNSPQASFGFSMGGVRKVGGYMKMRFSNLFSNTIISVEDALTDYPNTEKWTSKNKLLSISGGMLFRLGCPLHLNVGLGYGKRVQMYKLGEKTVTTTTNRYVDDDDYNYGSTSETTSTTENVCVEDKKSTVKGLVADLGLLLYLKHFSLRAGVSTIQFKYTDIEIGVGLNFGKKYKK